MRSLPFEPKAKNPLFEQPPEAIRKARLDNLSLVPASLLSYKDQYQAQANRLPSGSVLCVPGTPRQIQIIAKIKEFFSDKGHTVYTMQREQITRSERTTRTSRKTAETMQLAF